MIERLRRAALPLAHDALAAHREELVALAARHGLTDVRVFGSVARGTDRPGSDLDIVVARKPGIGLLTLATFAEQAGDLLGVEVDVVTDGGLAADHDILASAVAV